jgi:predicted dehydrogenase
MTAGGASGGVGENLAVAVIGLGYWGPNLIRNLHALPEVGELWACDLRPERLDAIVSRFPAIRSTPSYEAVLANPTIDAVLIATPISTHHRLGTAALRAGKHVFVEKPLAGSSRDALSLIDQAAERGLVLMPGHTFIYSPAVVLIRSLIESGEVGDIYFVSTSRVNLGIHQSDVSVAWDLGPHDFSILRHWLAETPARVSAVARGCIIPGTPDVAFIDLEYESGTIGHVELSWLSPSKLRRTTIVGSRKMVIYDDISAEPVRLFDSGAAIRDPATFGEYALTYRTGDILSPHIEAAEPIYRELEDFCRAILDGTAPLSSAELGLDVVRTIEAVDASLAARGMPVHLAPSGRTRENDPRDTRPYVTAPNGAAPLASADADAIVTV